jgi:UDP-glucose 4-epimerase
MSRNGVLMLGGAGFVGTALAKRLAMAGRKVHVLARQAAGFAVPGVDVHVGDMAHLAQMEPLLADCGTVVHLAASTTPGSSARHPDLELDALSSTLHVLEFLQERRDIHLVFLSSGGAVYGNAGPGPVDEDAPLAPVSYYGAGKMAMEAFFHAFRAAGHAATILRPANAYGPGQFPEQGFGLVRTTLEHALRGASMELWGDGENVRDFVYVDDVVSAIVMAVDSPRKAGTYNVGSGVGHTLNQVVAMAEQVSGRKILVEYRRAREVDVSRVVLDIARIQSVLGWRPNVRLEEGMRRTWEWLLKNRN